MYLYFSCSLNNYFKYILRFRIYICVYCYTKELNYFSFNSTIIPFIILFIFSSSLTDVQYLKKVNNFIKTNNKALQFNLHELCLQILFDLVDIQLNQN